MGADVFLRGDRFGQSGQVQTVMPQAESVDGGVDALLALLGLQGADGVDQPAAGG
jgi:hypothetical protein